MTWILRPLSIWPNLCFNLYILPSLLWPSGDELLSILWCYPCPFFSVLISLLKISSSFLYPSSFTIWIKCHLLSNALYYYARQQKRSCSPSMFSWHFNVSLSLSHSLSMPLSLLSLSLFTGWTKNLDSNAM